MGKDPIIFRCFYVLVTFNYLSANSHSHFMHTRICASCLSSYWAAEH